MTKKQANIIWFIAIILISVCIVPPASTRELDVYLYSHKKDNSETDYMLKLYEPQSKTWYTHSGTEKSDGKYEVAIQGNDFRDTLLGKDYVEGMREVKEILQAVIGADKQDGQWGTGTWLTFIKFLKEQGGEKAIKEITLFSGLDLNKLTCINVNQLLEADVSEENLSYLIWFSTEDKKDKFQVSQLTSCLNGIGLKLPQSFVTDFAAALANKRADIAKWAATENKVTSIEGFMNVLTKDYAKQADATDGLMQLVSLLDEHKIEAKDPYTDLLVNYLSTNKEKLSKSKIPFLTSASLTPWQNVVKINLDLLTTPWWRNPIWVALVAVAVLILFGVVFWGILMLRRRSRTETGVDETGQDIMDEVAPQTIYTMERRKEVPQQATGKPAEQKPTPDESYKQMLQQIEQGVKGIIEKTVSAEIAKQVQTAVENQLQSSLSKFNQSVEDVKKLAVGVNESIDQRIAQIDKIAAQKITDVGEQIHKLADDSRDELVRNATEASKQIKQVAESKQEQIQTTLQNAQNKIDLMIKNVYEHIDAWEKLIDEKHVEDIQRQHLKFDEILKGWNTDFNAVLSTLPPESSNQLPELEEIRGNVGEAKTLVSAIVEGVCSQFSVGKDKFGTILNDVNRLKEEIDQAIQLYQPLSEPKIESFNEYYNNLGGNVQPDKSIYFDYLRKLSDDYRDYFQKATDKLKTLLTVKKRPDDYFSERLERFATNSIVSFTYVLDDVIKNSGISPTDSIEANLQKLLEIVGLEEIGVNEKKDKYDATLHEPVRWINEGTLESNTIIQLLRRGFIFKSKVIRRARVVVRQ